MDRSIPSFVFRLPTMLLSFDKSGKIIESETAFFDEEKNEEFKDVWYIPIQIQENIVKHRTSVMPISIKNNYYGTLHCNAVIITPKAYELFEPRGDTLLDSQTSAVRTLYDPTNYFSYIRAKLTRWSTDERVLNLSKRITPGFHSSSILNMRFDPPNTRGIRSNEDTIRYSSECSTLVFNYINIRVRDIKIGKTRLHSHQKWLEYERQQT